MDMKGITWVGNVFEKLEAMCLEVEEIMYEDTIKYVENQVFTVGDGVKKFYSDVIQDLLPPSSVYPAKEQVSDALVEPNTDIGVRMKAKVGYRKKHGEVDNTEKLSENQKKIIDHNPDHRPASRELSHMDNPLPLAPASCSKRRLSKKSNADTTRSSGLMNQSPKGVFDKCFTRSTSSLEKPVEDDHIRQLPGCSKISADNDSSHSSTSSGVCHADCLLPIFLGDSGGVAPRGCNKGSLYNKSNLDTNKSCRRVKQFPSEPSGPLPSEEHENRPASRCERSNDNHQASSDQKATVATARAVEVAVCASIEENRIEMNNEDIPDISISKTPSVVINFAESNRSNKMDMKVSSHGSLLQESNDVCLNNKMVSLVDSGSNRSTQSIKFIDEGYLGRSDDHGTDVSEADIACGPEMENMQQVEETRLEETCITVNVDEFHFVPHSEGKSKPYKNIRDVFSSRKRSMRKKEYEQLAEWCSSGAKVGGEVHMSSSMLNTPTGKGPSSHDLCESEWELL